MLFVCYTPKFPENPEPNRTNRDLGRSCSVSSRSIGCSSRFGLGLGREVKNLIGIGLYPRTDTEHRAVSVHSQAWRGNELIRRRLLGIGFVLMTTHFIMQTIQGRKYKVSFP